MSRLLVPGAHDEVRWHGWFKVEKYEADAIAWGERTGRPVDPYEVVDSGPNLLLTAGITALWNRLAGLGGPPAAFDGTNARLCVGDSNAAVAVGQTDLQAATNKFRKVVNAAPTVNANQIAFVATFGAGDANFAWNEAGIANSAAGATLLNRVVQAFGVKTSSVTWVMTGTVSLT